MGEVIKSYKGFNRDMTCNPEGTSFQYEEGREYEEDNAEACECGFHACEIRWMYFRIIRPARQYIMKLSRAGRSVGKRMTAK